MRMFSPEELDVMAEAYIRALDRLPVESPTTELTRRLVEQIGEALADGIRDEDELAAAAIRRSNIRPELSVPRSEEKLPVPRGIEPQAYGL